MFEMFTDNARRAVVLAQEVAREMQHGSAQPAHLLLGLTMSKGSATEALESLDLSTDVVRAEVAKLPEAPWTRHLAEETEEVLQQARIEATTLRHPWIRSGHLLLALLDQPQATRILSALGASDGTVRNRVLERLEATALELNSDVPAKRAT